MAVPFTTNMAVTVLLLLPWLALTAGSAPWRNGTLCSQHLASDDTISRSEQLEMLTRPSCYDRWQRPPPLMEPLKVSVRSYIQLFKSSSSLTFSLMMLLQLKYHDPRLISSIPTPLVGGTELLSHFWTPHVYLASEQDSDALRSTTDDVIVAVHPDGVVVLTLRLNTTLICWMRLGKFPFDQQQCPLVLESWRHPNSEVVLVWEQSSPIAVPPMMHLTEYRLLRVSTVAEHQQLSRHRLQGASPANYSSLTATFHLARQTGHYLMDYYVPSVLLVIVSWVSFWLDDAALSGRIALGSNTLLAFVTLSSSRAASLPKVSYIKADDVWFMGCTAFIFSTLLEFAFVNIIWRRNHNVELKKVNSKYILKSTLTPNTTRRKLKIRRSRSFDRSSSYPEVIRSLDAATSSVTVPATSCSSRLQLPSSWYQSSGQLVTEKNDSVASSASGGGFTTMTPQQVAHWIDRRSRIFFPTAFVVFNAVYWGMVLVL